MNKSIVLAMCDILVLSAMSLSSGGFSEVPQDSVEPLRVITRQEFDEGQRLYSVMRMEVEQAQEEVIQARDAVAKSKAEAESAVAERDKARSESEQARDAAAKAKAEAESAVAERDKARSESEQARDAAAKANAELEEIHQRQNALSGKIPHDIVWKIALQIRTRKGTKSVDLYSPLVTIDGRNLLFFERSWLADSPLEDIVSIEASHEDERISGKVLEGPGTLLFVNLNDVSKRPHIGFGVEKMNLDNNLVFYPKSGTISGNPVPCFASNGKFTCSSKTEARKGYQWIKGDYSVFEGCFLISKVNGSITAIVRGDSTVATYRDCEVQHPISVSSILATTSGEVNH